MIIELHILQNFAPSCLNRDDTNSPKDCEFGGYRRARISSQCIKRAIREEFRKGLLDSEMLANRTRLLTDQLTKRINIPEKNQEDVKNVVLNAISSMGLALKENKTEYLLFIGSDEINNMAEIIKANWDKIMSIETDPSKGKKEAKAALSDIGKELLKVMDGGKAVDLALFGRMLADLPEKKVDAAAQVAHAISTNKVSTEFDFYTAVDDFQTEGESGAGMMGTIEFNSACYYRYANIDMNQLIKNLGNDKGLAKKAVEAFVKASISAVPTGKQTSMAAQNPPSFILAVVRNSGMWSLANAFTMPVSPKNGDLVTRAVDALINYWNKLVKCYGSDTIKGHYAVVIDEIDIPGLNIACSVNELVSGVRDCINDC